MHARSDNVHEQDIVILDRGDYTSCTVNLHGANITSWRINNQEMIFVSRCNHFSGEWRFGPNNGFARLLSWTVNESPVKTKTGDVYAIFSLTDNAYSRSLWNHKFKLYYKILLRETSIACDLRVENPSKLANLDFVIMQHALMRVRDTKSCEIVGFKGCAYKDVIRNKTLMDNCDTVKITERIDRMYLTSPEKVIIKNTVKGGNLMITRPTCRNFSLWNPWSDNPFRTKEDEDNDEYQYFIGVGAGIMSDSVQMEPLSCWSAFQTFEFIEPIQNAPRGAMVKHFYDWFNGFC